MAPPPQRPFLCFRIKYQCRDARRPSRAADPGRCPLLRRGRLLLVQPLLPSRRAARGRAHSALRSRAAVPRGARAPAVPGLRLEGRSRAAELEGLGVVARQGSSEGSRSPGLETVTEETVGWLYFWYLPHWYLAQARHGSPPSRGGLVHCRRYWTTRGLPPVCCIAAIHALAKALNEPGKLPVIGREGGGAHRARQSAAVVL